MIPNSKRERSRGGLRAELQWFVQLRWFAGVATVVGAMLDWQWLRWSDRPIGLVVVGLCVLIYNAGLQGMIARAAGAARPNRSFLLWLAGAQVLLDLACLTMICLWTGGAHSPFAAFFVFHMVFGSLLLPSRIAYGVALSAGLMLGGGALLGEQWPLERQDVMRIAALCFTLLFTVHLANHLTRGLRRQRRRLLRQNRRIRAMAEQLHQHQQTMVQHEKMIALGHMAAGVTHEINNPLASMDGLLQLMLRKPQRMTEASLHTLREQIGRINQIVQQMKTFARPDSMKRVSVSLNEVVERALGILQYDARLERIEVVKDLQTNPPPVPVFLQAMEQVLVNLIQNAIDAMEQTAKPTLTLRTRHAEGFGVIDVIDNGHGIEPSSLDRIFEPFFTTKPVGKGTGLGLSISYSLVGKQGGTLAAQNVAGGGAIFTIRLPSDAHATPVEADTSRNREAMDATTAISEKSTG